MLDNNMRLFENKFVPGDVAVARKNMSVTRKGKVEIVRKGTRIDVTKYNMNELNLYYDHYDKG